MNFLENKKRLLAAALISTLAFGTLQSVGATTIQNAKDKINETNQNLDEVNRKIDDIERQQNGLQNEIDALDSELVNLLLDISILEDEIDLKTQAIEKATQDLEIAQEQADTQYEQMKSRIRFMYERGDNVMIEALLGAGSMADFLNRVEYFNQIYDYDRNMLDEYKETIAQVATLKQNLELEQQEMVALLENQEHQSQELKKLLDSKRATMSDFDTKLAQAENLAKQYKETIRQQNEIIVAEQARIAREEERRRQEEERRRREEEERRRQEQLAAANNNNNNTSNESGGDDSQLTGGSDPAYATNISGQEVVDFAKQFIGNPYVWGGTSLTNGCDCSGFVMSVFAHFGISLPHSSLALRSCGREVSYNNAKPGDLICYSGHVAIYIGGGRIVGAQSTAVGIATQNATYRQILSVRRVL